MPHLPSRIASAQCIAGLAARSSRRRRRIPSPHNRPWRGRHRSAGYASAAVGPRASELIHEIVVAMRFRATARQLMEIPHYHPTLSEIWTYPAEELAEGM